MTAGPESPQARSGASRAVRVSVILPTFNERENVRPIVAALREALEEVGEHEILVVDDDSPDGTWREVDALAARDPRVRCYRRIDRRGLSSAIVDGLSMATGESLVVMDADLQHDPATVPRLVAALAQADVAVASRYVAGGSTGEWSKRGRRWASRAATWLARRMLGLATTDPMSGFFAIRRVVFGRIASRLQPRGFKALMEILYRAKGARVTDVPYTFASRRAGDSKLGGEVMIDFFASMLELATGRSVSARFLQYCLVGLSGVAVQLGALVLLQRILADEWALALAILTAMVSNFLLNNLWTFRDRRLTRLAAGTGLARFVAISGIGAWINHAVSLRTHELTGVALVWSSLAGITLATIWNYHLNRGITWRMWKRPE